MGNFNPGVGTGMNSALKKSSSFKRDDKNVANNPDAKSPEEGGNANEQDSVSKSVHKALLWLAKQITRW